MQARVFQLSAMIWIVAKLQQGDSSPLVLTRMDLMGMVMG
jgi:hypothetical protein